jgi:hypothetical protein
MSGLLAPQAEITIEIAQQEGESMISAEENAKTRTFLMENWNLGPEKTAQPNMDYWRKLSKAWRIAPEQAKRNLCANCEYFNDSPDMLAKMESVPEDQFDKDGGGRGWCSKWDFICHNLRTCQAWEKGEQPESEGEDYENGDMMEEENGND